jgi:hypothetical protein
LNQVLPAAAHSRFRLPVNLLSAIAPGLLWLGFLYRTSARYGTRISPAVLTIYIVAALLAAAIIRPFLYEFIDLDAWLAQVSTLNRLAGSVLIAGSSHAFVFYAVIRYTVWPSQVFAKRTDGVMYSIAASLGYSTALNVLTALDLGGMALLNGNLHLITQSFVFMAGGLINGYFLGRNRFEDMPFFYAGAGVALCSVLIGGLLHATTALNSTALGFRSDGFSPWPGVVVSALGLIITFLAAHGLLDRHNSLTRARLEKTA